MGLNQFDFLNYDIFCKQVAAVVSQDKINGIIDNDFCDYQRSLGRKFEKLNIVLQHNFALKNKGLTLEQIQKRYRIWIPDFLTYCRKRRFRMLGFFLAEVVRGIMLSWQCKNIKFEFWAVGYALKCFFS